MKSQEDELFKIIEQKNEDEEEKRSPVKEDFFDT